jgi:hypothetical protein
MEVMVELRLPAGDAASAHGAQASTPEPGGRAVASSTKRMSLLRPELRNLTPHFERLASSTLEMCRHELLSRVIGRADA